LEIKVLVKLKILVEALNKVLKIKLYGYAQKFRQCYNI